VVSYTIKLEERPHNARFSSNGKLAYIRLQGGAGIGVIDTGARKMIREIRVPGITGRHNIDISADERRAFVRDVAAVDMASGKLERIIMVGNGHAGIDIIPDGRYVVTAAIGDSLWIYVTAMNTETMQVEKKIAVGQFPFWVAMQGNPVTAILHTVATEI